MIDPAVELHIADLRVVLTSLMAVADAQAKSAGYSSELRREALLAVEAVEKVPTITQLGEELLSISKDLLEAGEVRVALSRAAEVLRYPNVL